MSFVVVVAAAAAVVVVVDFYFERRNCPSSDVLRRQIPSVTILVYSVESVF